MGPRGRILVVALAAGLIAGVISTLVGERIVGAYRGDLLPTIAIRPSPESIRRLNAARLSSAAGCFATLGGTLGLALGIAGGLSRRSASAASGAAILGLALGAGAGAAISWACVPAFFRKYDPQSNELVLPLLTHGAIWSIVGAAGGLAFGLGAGRWKAAMAGGLAGAAAATIVYEIVGALAFPGAKTDLPLSTTMAARAMAQILVATLTAAGAALALGRSPKANPPASSSITVGADHLAAGTGAE